MIEPLDQRAPPMTPQLALRVAIVGSIALVFFAVIFFRLWFLQVLTGSDYAAEAQGNIVRDIPIAAPRGDIFTSDGATLVASQRVPAVVIEPPDLPIPITLATVDARHVQLPSKDYPVFDELAKVLRMSTKPAPCGYQVYLSGPAKKYNPELAEIPCLVAQSVANAQFANVTIKTDVSPDIQAYIDERQTESYFQGVQAQDVYLREYPEGKLAAQVFGTVGQLEPKEVRKGTDVGKGNFKGANETDVVGQTGLEYEYNQFLMGADGSERVKVNAAGEFEGYAKSVAPTSGENLKLSLDLNLERVGDTALQKAITDNSPATSGAFVAMDPANGQIYAMGSLPSYKPSIFTHPIPTAVWNSLNDAASNQPLINRAIAGPLPDGSTFKVITATAALESGKWGVDEPYDDTGQFVYDPNESCNVPGNCLHNSGGAAYGSVALERAIQVSDDVYFYHLGYILNGGSTGSGGALQKWARQFGIGQTTGVDLPGESSGTLPSPDYFQVRWKEEQECETATGLYAGLRKHPAVIVNDQIVSGGCGIASSPDWGVGDNVNTAVGQGDVQVTPLQLAVVYAALANPNGAVVTPHIAQDIQAANGTVLQKIDPAPKRYVKIAAPYRDAILQGLHAAAQSSGGTSDDVMGDFGMPVYGKTGTAQEGTAEEIATNTETDYAWYACFVPATATSKPIVVVVSVEKGGFGDIAAAPVARQILSQWFYGKPGPYKAGSSPDT
jgi:penicillin-binding protein 2